MARSFAVAAFAVLAAAVLLAAPASAAKTSCTAYTDPFEANVLSACPVLLSSLPADSTGGAGCVYNGTASSDALLAVIKTAYGTLTNAQKWALNTTTTAGYDAAMTALTRQVALSAAAAETSLCTKAIAFASVPTYATVTVTVVFTYDYTGDAKSVATDQAIGSSVKKACTSSAGGNSALTGVVTATSNAGGTSHAVRRLLAASPWTYTASVPVANAAAANSLSTAAGTSAFATALATSANAAIVANCPAGETCATVATPTVTAATKVSGASALAASVLSVASAMLVLLFGF